MTSEPSRSYIFDAESSVELVRLMHQERFLTEAMGGALAGIDDPALQTVLDLACGPGWWALDVAFQLPDAEVIGVDISQGMLDYARARAQSQGISNVSFGTMDITSPLDFSDASFDLVNGRLLFGALLREAWLPLLTECMRIVKPGGLIRLTEMVGSATSSAAVQQQFALMYRYLHLRGYAFSPDGTTIGVSTVVPRLLKELGCKQISHRAHVQDYSQGSPYWGTGYRNMELLSLNWLPFYVSKGLISQEDADRLHQQTMIEYLADDFCAMGYYHTILAVRPD